MIIQSSNHPAPGIRTWVRVVRLGAVVPAALAGSFIAILGLGFLPGAGLVGAFAMTALLALILACGLLEAPAARVLGVGRGLSGVSGRSRGHADGESPGSSSERHGGDVRAVRCGILSLGRGREASVLLEVVRSASYSRDQLTSTAAARFGSLLKQRDAPEVVDEVDGQVQQLPHTVRHSFGLRSHGLGQGDAVAG